MKSAILVLSTAFGIVESKNALETLFTYNCEGQVHLLPDGIGGGALDMSVVERMWSTYADRVKQRVRCQCPYVSNQALDERYGLFHNFAEYLLNPNAPVARDACLDSFSDPTMDLAKFMRNYLRIPLQFDVSEVSTCPSASLQTEDGRCLFQIDIPKADTQLQVAMLTCDSGRPSFSLHCGGKFCDTFKPCESDADCSGSCRKFTTLGQYMAEPVTEMLDMFGLSLSSCGQGVDSFIGNIFRRVTGSQFATGICTPTDEQIAAVDDAMTNDIRSYVTPTIRSGRCGDDDTNVLRVNTLRAWDGLLAGGEDAIYNLEFSPYPKVSALPLGKIGATFNCKDELLIPYFGLRVDVSPTLQAVTEELIELWKCQGLNQYFFAYNNMVWNPGFLTAAFTDFQDSVYAEKVCTLAAKLVGAPSEACTETGMVGFPKKMLPPTSTMGYLHWSMYKAMSAMYDVSKIIDFDVTVKMWTEECKSHPLGLPAISLLFGGEVIDSALTFQQGCSSDSECPRGTHCTALASESLPFDGTSKLLWETFDNEGCFNKMSFGLPAAPHTHKCASKKEFLRDMLIIDPFSSEKKHEVLDLYTKQGLKVCIAKSDVKPISDDPLAGLGPLNEPNPFSSE